MKRSAFTLVEMLVVIAIIGILVAITAPGLIGMREEARRLTCMGQLARIGAALHTYQSAYNVYPPGVIDDSEPIRSQPKGKQIGWLVHLLPYLDETAVYRAIDQSAGVYSPKCAEARNVQIQLLVCPSMVDDAYRQPGDPEVAAICRASGQEAPWGIALSTYAACHHDVEAPIDADNQGVFFLNSHVTDRDIIDGLTFTLFAGEKTLLPWNDSGWMAGNRATLRNTGTPINHTRQEVSQAMVPPGMKPPPPPQEPAPETPPQAAQPPMEIDVPKDPWLYVGGFGSNHGDAANFLMGDGSVKMIHEKIDATVYRQLGSRADGKLIPNRDIF
jgi:prepilin-type N-terminal cleavage/methylation domain-containing protein/prepilin-type processing-associated H-X9-DG protein